ncbi:hypothetical protein SAMD00019534_010590 [Acytostelium subglobosum LB1]|uniref:hypothetical protein n=1 Tax=Acytostelium subglobosum LB1 TaxID=1410327 RepID=UPI000644B4F4|nr:hypothetical protein SAMD00019534_010590 [Acytostelium subglobosum LB1]GAM17884.1 hypothetical protein SAMD00019534_010590 [Acytostelium subglobosum LB1]|eukprot:XP_012758480.1 hypothetical protein SAMD00019534_010590 [Acytostelium subglobosum LB1]
MLLYIIISFVVLINSLQWGDALSCEAKDPNIIAQNLANAIKFPTISQSLDSEIPTNYTPYTQFITYLETTYPLVHTKLNRTVVNQYSLLFEWKGRNRRLKPIFINGHYDVVPVEPSQWSVDPFGGVILNGTIWGRGAIDNKLIVIAALEAVESLLLKSFIPERTVFLAFGHDEEIGGNDGHKKISELVQSRNITAEMIIDEGLPIMAPGFLPGLITQTTAMVGVFEKGYIFYNITAKGQGGHSSMPPSTQSPIGILSKAITTLESNQLPAPNSTMRNEFLEQFPSSTISAVPFLDYMRRTTTTVTLIRGGIKSNVLATSATAWISHRVVPGDDIDAIIARNNRLINDSRISVVIEATLPPSPYSNISTDTYKTLRRTLMYTFGGDLLVKSGLMFANTDTRHYWPVSSNIYRIMPIIGSGADLGSIHGFNEKLNIDNLVNAVAFYRELIKQFNIAD